MQIDAALDFVRPRRQGVLTTQRRDGRPQLSNILFLLGEDGLIRVSVTNDRAKTKNLRRDPRASLYVPGDDFWSYLVLEGDAQLSAVAADPGDEVVQELEAFYRSAGGDHPNWDEFRQSMVDDGRLVVRFRAERAYGMPRPPTAT